MTRLLRMALLAALGTVTLLSTTGSARAQGTVIASDNFNRPNETPFSASGNWGHTIAGNYNGFSNLVNNQVVAVSNEGSYYWNGPGTFDPTRQFSRLKVVQKDGEVGLTLLAGPDQAIMVAWGPPGVGDTVYIYWYSGGSDRGQLSTGPSTINNGDVIEAALEGGIIYAKVNGVTVKTVSNTTTLTSGKPGFITFRNPNLPDIAILDDWQGGTPQSYSIGGTITENASGLSGVQVAASGGFTGTTTTDGTGAYTLLGVPAGATSIVLTPTLSGHTMTPLSRTVAGPLAGNVAGQDFTSALNTFATLTTNAVNGSVLRSPNQATYTFGADVTLTPVPATGYNFASWTGDVPSGHETDNPLHVIMDADKTLTAHFTAPDIVAADAFNRADETPLAVGGNWQRSLGTGFSNLAGNHVTGASGDAVYYWQGSGTFDPARQFARVKVVNAGGPLGVVLLGATDQALVVSWGGGQLSVYWYLNGTNQGVLTSVPSTLNNGDVVEALLDGGSVYAKINGAVVASVANTTSLASGRPGFETNGAGAGLDDWEAGTPDSFTISGTITENAAGLGGVTVTASGGFAGSATTNGNGQYTVGGVPANATAIVLTPALPGHTMTPLTRTVAGPVTAPVIGQNFTSTQNTTATLTVLAPHGTVAKNPDLSVFAFGAAVTLTPTPDAGYEFASWSGDVPAGHALDNPLQVSMTQDRTITAVFVLPGVVTADYFDRPNEEPLTEGGNWKRVREGGIVDLHNNQVESFLGDALYFWQGAGTFNDQRQFSRLKVVQADGQVGLILLAAEGRALVVSWGNGRLYIYWYFNNVHQGELLNQAAVLNSGDVIEAVLDQGTVYAKRNGVVVASVPNATSLTTGRPGFETYNSGVLLDNWESGSPAASCVGAPNGTACNDGNACTTGDACSGGACVGVNGPTPGEIQGVAVSGQNATGVTWTAAAGAVYDIASSTLADLRANGASTATCLVNDLGVASFADPRPNPAPDAGYYYLIRTQSVCGTGSYGFASSGAERLPTTACP